MFRSTLLFLGLLFLARGVLSCMSDKEPCKKWDDCCNKICGYGLCLPDMTIGRRQNAPCKGYTEPCVWDNECCHFLCKNGFCASED